MNRQLPELPAAAQSRLRETYGSSDYRAVLTENGVDLMCWLDEVIPRAQEQILLQWDNIIDHNDSQQHQQQEQSQSSIKNNSLFKVASATANLLTNEVIGLFKKHHTVMTTDGDVGDNYYSQDEYSIRHCPLVPVQLVVILPSQKLKSKKQRRMAVAPLSCIPEEKLPVARWLLLLNRTRQDWLLSENGDAIATIATTPSSKSRRHLRQLVATAKSE